MSPMNRPTPPYNDTPLFAPRETDTYALPQIAAEGVRV